MSDAHHEHEINHKEYWVIFVLLTILTGLEVGVVYVPGIPWGALVSALIAMAVAKAALVLMFYMHLKHETKVLQATVIIPLLIPAFYALVLIGEATWRLLAA